MADTVTVRRSFKPGEILVEVVSVGLYGLTAAEVPIAPIAGLKASTVQGAIQKNTNATLKSVEYLGYFKKDNTVQKTLRELILFNRNIKKSFRMLCFDYQDLPAKGACWIDVFSDNTATNTINVICYQVGMGLILEGVLVANTSAEISWKTVVDLAQAAQDKSNLIASQQTITALDLALIAAEQSITDNDLRLLTLEAAA